MNDDEGCAKVSVFEETRNRLARCPGLSESERDKLAGIARDMPFVSDISRADLLLYACHTDREAVLIAQARPRSIVPVRGDDLIGYRVGPEDEPTVFRALRWRRRMTGSRRLIDGGAPVTQRVWVVHGDGGRTIAALDVEANLIAYVRQRSRSRVFQRAVDLLQAMLLVGELRAADELSAFREHDGVLIADKQRVIRYASGIATEHYRKLGYMDSLTGRHLSTLDTGDQLMFAEVARDLRCYQREFVEQPYLHAERARIWIRQAIPLIGYGWGQPFWQPVRGLKRGHVGVLFAIHDATEERHKERELKVKSAMIQEVHHRVKNNLQTVAALLRMQIRRSDNEEANQILRDSVSRIFSMAVVHEYLSRSEGQAINLREVTQRIIQQIRQGTVSPEKTIHIVLESGHNLYLPARQATACALVINELLQNAVDHGYETRNLGTVSLRLDDEGDQVSITISDDGAGLPPGFEIEQSSSLGLQIVKTLVEEDLRGQFEIRDTGGVQAAVRFSKKEWEGEAHWNG